MRYAQRGGYTPAEQQRRERLRLEAAGRFARGDGINDIARDLRVTLNVHLAPELAGFARENQAWLRIYRLPAYAPELNPAEASGRCSSGPWSTSPPPTWPA
jgi:hypothetical protein